LADASADHLPDEINTSLADIAMKIPLTRGVDEGFTLQFGLVNRAIGLIVATMAPMAVETDFCSLD
jgi:hypothetical protein